MITLLPLRQNEASYKTNHKELCYAYSKVYFDVNQTHFLYERFVRGLFFETEAQRNLEMAYWIRGSPSTWYTMTADISSINSSINKLTHLSPCPMNCTWVLNDQ